MNRTFFRVLSAPAAAAGSAAWDAGANITNAAITAGTMNVNRTTLTPRPTGARGLPDTAASSARAGPVQLLETGRGESRHQPRRAVTRIRACGHATGAVGRERSRITRRSPTLVTLRNWLLRTWWVVTVRP